MSIEAAVPRTEAEWQAEYDAETLARAEVIKNDVGRFDKAQIAAGKIAEREKEEAAAMTKVAGRKRPSGSGSGSGGTKQKSQRNSGGRVAGGNHNVFQKI